MSHQFDQPYETIIDQEIACRAFDYWQKRGSPLGSPEEDWFRAVADLRQESELHADSQLRARPA